MQSPHSTFDLKYHGEEMTTLLLRALLSKEQYFCRNSLPSSAIWSWISKVNPHVKITDRVAYSEPLPGQGLVHSFHSCCPICPHRHHCCISLPPFERPSMSSHVTISVIFISRLLSCRSMWLFIWKGVQQQFITQHKESKTPFSWHKDWDNVGI